MIQSLELLGVLYGHDVADVFYYTYSRSVTLRIGADAAGLGIGYVVAHLAVFHFVLELDDGIAEGFYGAGILTQKMQDQSHRSFFSYARKFGKLADGFFQQGRRILLIHAFIFVLFDSGP